MALLVHLPLTGDLHNQGLAEITYTGTPVFKTTGKIGNSAFDLSHRVVFNCPSLDGIKTFSIAFWAKVNSDTNLSTNWVDVISFTDRKSDGSVTGVFRWETCYNGANYTNWGISVHDNGYYNISDLAGIPQATGKNIWHHIVITVDLENNEVKEYLNGVLVGTATCNGGSLTGAFHLGENNLINGEIQDVRVYSHCLSQKKISELKKALVLHYPLDNNGVGNKNISSKYVSCGSGNPDNTNNGGRTKYYGDYGVIIPAVEKADTYFTIWTTESLENGQIYTLSANVSGLIEGTYYRFPLFAQDNSSMGTICFDHNGRNSLTFTMNYTGTINTVTRDGKTYYKLFMDDITRDIASGQGEITINNIKLEKGSIATPWCPNSSDDIYTALGYDDGIEYDTSGYGNNGTKVGTLSYSTDSPRYLASTVFDGTQRIHADALPLETQTVSLWMKTTRSKNTAQCIFGDSASALCMFVYSGGLITYFRGSNGGTGSRVVFGDEYKENNWNHLVVVKTGETTRDVYCNGVKLTPANNNFYTHAEGFWIGARNASNNLPFYGYIADIRAYATQLSAEDIQKLYTVSASIDSNGNAYSAAYVEG